MEPCGFLTSAKIQKDVDACKAGGRRACGGRLAGLTDVFLTKGVGRLGRTLGRFNKV